MDKRPFPIGGEVGAQLKASGWDGYIDPRESRVTVYGGDALEKFGRDFSFDHALDTGCGSGTHARFLRRIGKKVTTIDIRPEIMGFKPELVGDFMAIALDRQYDGIWCSHTLEHMPNPNMFLKKVFATVRDGGPVAITVPPLKHAVVNGHVTLWNAGVLLYNLVLAGFDCSKASVKTYGYNVSVIVEKKGHGLSEWTDLSRLQAYFPMAATQGFDGRLPPINW